MASVYGYAPTDTDRLSLYELGAMLQGAQRRRTEQREMMLLHASIVAGAVYNWGGPRTKEFRSRPLGAFFEAWTGGAAPPETPEERLAAYHAAVAQSEAFMDAVRSKQARLGRTLDEWVPADLN